MGRKRRKRKLTLNRQQWLLATLGAVVIAGVAYTLYQQQGLGGFLLGRVSGQCSPPNVRNKVPTNPATATVKAGDLLPGSRGVKVGNTKSAVEQAARQKAIVSLKCPTKEDVQPFLNQPGHRCGNGCKASGAPQTFPIGVEVGSAEADRPTCSVKSSTVRDGRSTRMLWTATAQCTGMCQAVDVCIPETPTEAYSVACNLNKQEIGVGEWVIAYATIAGGQFNPSWSAPGAAAGSGPSGTAYQAKYDTPGVKSITVSVQFPDRFRSHTCRVTVKGTATAAPKPTTAPTIIPTSTPRITPRVTPTPTAIPTKAPTPLPTKAATPTPVSTPAQDTSQNG